MPRFGRTRMTKTVSIDLRFTGISHWDSTPRLLFFLAELPMLDPGPAEAPFVADFFIPQGFSIFVNDGVLEVDTSKLTQAVIGTTYHLPLPVRSEDYYRGFADNEPPFTWAPAKRWSTQGYTLPKAPVPNRQSCAVYVPTSYGKHVVRPPASSVVQTNPSDVLKAAVSAVLWGELHEAG